MNPNAFRTVLATIALWAGLVPTSVKAAFPEKPVTIVVPFAPGGSSDAIARIVAQGLSARWKQSVIVENRAGGQTVIGTGLVARSPADGYTIAFVSYAWSTNPILMKELPYKVTDMAPVTLLGLYPLALYVRREVPADTLKEFAAYITKRGKPATIGNAGVGSSVQLAALDMADATGMQVISVPYKSGTVGAINDVIGGQIDGAFEGRTFKQHVDSGRLKALYIGLRERAANWPEVPSATDAGFPQLDLAAYFGLMVPANTAVEVRARIAQDVRAVVEEPEVHRRLSDLGLVVQPTTPQEFGSFLESTGDRLRRLIDRHRAQMTE